MATIYVGTTSAGAANGTSWANRYGSLNAAEDRPVVAGDTVYVGPGVYRELLTVDVSGGAGSPITYIGDVDGSHTDGIGGIVRITGSDDDQTATRNDAVSITDKDYRTFRGFTCDTFASHPIYLATGCTNIIIEDCSLISGAGSASCCYISGTSATITVRRCVLIANLYSGYGLNITHSSTVDNSAITVENCFITAGSGVYIERVGGVTVRNCVFYACGSRGVRVAVALSVGQVCTVNNCILCLIYGTALNATTTAEFAENYNSLYANQTDRSNVNVGANSNTYPPLFNMPLLLDGFRFPWFFGELSKWSQLARIAGTSEATDDLFGLTRPATSAKKSWGAIQATGAAREATTVDSGTASLKLPDAGEQFFMRVPVTAVATTFTVKCYREANYAGTNPTLIVRQAGQADQTYTDVGAAGAWNTLTVTCTPAADPEWVDLFVVSYNTAVAGSFSCYWDTATVS